MANGPVDVEVVFGYHAEHDDELTIRTGDVIKDVKPFNGGWWEGLLNGKRGLFPDNFVKVLNKTVGKDGLVELRKIEKNLGSPVSFQNRCRVLYSYQPQHDDELELRIDDVIDFIEEVEEGWWKGMLRGRTGVFPSNFVELLRTSTSVVDASKESTFKTNSTVEKNKKNEKMTARGRITSLIQDVDNRTSIIKSPGKEKQSTCNDILTVDKSHVNISAAKLPLKSGVFPDVDKRRHSFLNLPSRRHSTSTLVSASNDFYFYDNEQEYEEDKMSMSDINFSPTSSKKGRLSQLFSLRLNLESPKKNRRQSWASAFFGKRGKIQDSAIFKIDEEVADTVSTSTKVDTSTQVTTDRSTSVKIRAKSRSERDLEVISHLCPVTGGFRIERGSQTDIEMGSFGLGSLWGNKFRRHKTTSTQTLPDELFDDCDQKSSIPSSSCASVNEIYYRTGLGNSATSLIEKPYSESLDSIMSNPALFTESCGDLTRVLGGSSKPKKRNRIITNPKLFVQIGPKARYFLLD